MNLPVLLVVDDNPGDRALCLRHLSRAGGFRTVEAGTLAAARASIEEHDPAVLVLDFNLPDGTGLSLLKELVGRDLDTAVVMLTGGGDETLAVEAMKSGAFDYLPKNNLDGARLVRSVEGALTERRLRSELRERCKELEARNRELKTYASAVAHDLRAPLQAILAGIEVMVLLHGEALPPQAHNRLGRVTESVDRMATMLDALLEYAQAGTLPGESSCVDLLAVGLDVKGDLEPLAEKQGGAIHVGPLPRIWARPEQVRQVFQNLVDNALKHGARNVSLEGLRTQRGWRLTVRDDGPGIPAQDQRRIFDVFQRGGSEEVPGVGLGLAITRKLVDGWGGGVSVESTEGEGASFHIEVPQAMVMEDLGT